MPQPPGPRGRGAASDPPNRFERLHVELDPEPEALDPDDPSAPPRGSRTIFLRDTSRTVIARNDSPDVPFDASLNPYRGCEHGCAYCLSGDTPILMANGTTRSISDVKVGDAIYGTRRRGWYRRYVKTTVIAHWRTTRPAWRVTLEDGTVLVASGDHRFLTDRGWKHVTGSQQGAARRPHLTTRSDLRGTGGFSAAPVHCERYRRGYLCGLVRGDGLLKSYHYSRPGRAHGDQHCFRLAMLDTEALDRAERWLHAFGVKVRRFAFAPGNGRARVPALGSRAQSSVELVRALVRWPVSLSHSWCAGFLAGLFDAEGSYGQDRILRIANTDPRIVELAARSFAEFGFRYRIETRAPTKPLIGLRMLGGVPEHLRFFHRTDPAISRKRDLSGCAVKSAARLHVVSIEALREHLPMYDMTTGTGDFIANGVISHNCYARPTHEYLGFSAGLDFETRILVKEEAPELLRRELSARRWRPRVLALSGVTDPYQPAERKLRLTRRCLEVLAEFRNPVGIVTKNELVTRDVDLLGELAAHHAVAVAISVTTLDPALTGVMEPRTSRPQRRLAAIARLAQAGIPARVMVAPVIPGLTDHEIPAILRAAADAGASGAGYVLLRLPGAVAPLFGDWLARHFPERRAKVLGRVRELRGGRLNDPSFGTRMRGEGEWARQIESLFEGACRRLGLARTFDPLSTAAFRGPGQQRLPLAPPGA